MYNIAVLDQDKAYLERLISFLKEHHKSSFKIDAVGSLDDLNMESVQYSALFFGDDIAVDAALFPADVAIGYLTEKSESGEQYINKYQSMEQIYRRMMKLCSKDGESGVGADSRETQAKPAKPVKPEVTAAEYCDLKGETVTEDGETYRVYHIPEEDADRLAIRMLTGNNIKGLFRAEFCEGRLKIRITGLKSLYDYVQENNTPKGKRQLLKFFADMAATALSLEEYMLSADKLMLNPREIYVDAEQSSVFIPYIPLKGGGPKDSRQYLQEIRGLCSVLIGGIAEEVPRVLTVKEIGAQECGSAEKTDNQQKNAQGSVKPKENTKTPRKAAAPYIVRKRTGEKIIINRNLYKLGKDVSSTDYCIRDNPAVSRNHADIVRKKDGFYLVDKGSLNHTFVNGRKLAADEFRKLENGCLIQLADEVFEFRLK